MKKVLLASSALVASVAVTAPAAAGEVTWNAFTHFFASSSYEESGADAESDIQDFNTNSEIHLKFEDTADNGLTYGFKIELEADQNATDNVDENYIFLSGDWGRVELGDNDGAADQLDVVGTSGFTYGMLNNSTGGTFNADGVANRNTRTAANLNDSSDDTKITYLTPSFSGFTAGISYAPESNTGNSVADSAGGEDHFEVGLNYSGDFDGFGLTAAITANHEEINEDDDQTGVQAGVEVSVAGFTVGLAGAHIDNDNTGETDTVNFGVSYSAGAWTVAGGALYSEFDADAANSDEELTAVTAGVSYNIAPGLTASLGGTYGENEVDNSDDREFNTVVAGIQVSF